MNKLILASLAGVSLLVLAACGEGEKKSEAQPAQPAQTETVPAETAPANDQTTAPATPNAGQAQETLNNAAASMTDEQKQQAVASARAEAEAAAKAAGQSEEVIKQLGDQAEAAAKQAFGIE